MPSQTKLQVVENAGSPDIAHPWLPNNTSKEKKNPSRGVWARQTLIFLTTYYRCLRLCFMNFSFSPAWPHPTNCLPKAHILSPPIFSLQCPSSDFLVSSMFKSHYCCILKECSGQFVFCFFFSFRTKSHIVEKLSPGKIRSAGHTIEKKQSFSFFFFICSLDWFVFF